MSFSFDETLPTTKDRVRAVIGDTNSAAPLRSDEAIAATLALYAGTASPVTDTVAFLALSLANEYRTRPDRVALADGSSYSWADRVKGWDQLARDIRAGKVAFDAVIASATSESSSLWGAPVNYTTDVLEPAREIA